MALPSVEPFASPSSVANRCGMVAAKTATLKTVAATNNLTPQVAIHGGNLNIRFAEWPTNRAFTFLLEGSLCRRITWEREADSLRDHVSKSTPTM